MLRLHSLPVVPVQDPRLKLKEGGFSFLYKDELEVEEQVARFRDLREKIALRNRLVVIRRGVMDNMMTDHDEDREWAVQWGGEEPTVRR
jgi:hypothetical protein